MSADDFRDYLNQQAQAQHMAETVEGLFRDPEREAADVEQVVENTARAQIAHIAEQADSFDDALVDVLGEVRDLRGSIDDRSLTVGDAKKALLELRQRRGAIKTSVDTLRSRYDSTLKAAKNPAARRDELINKYGL